MSKRISRVLTVCLLLIYAAVPSFAQSGAATAYSPYSIYGVGDLYSQGTARDMAMAGVGIAGRDPRYLNITNPAAVSVRDTLSVMFSIGVRNDNKTFSQGDIRSANNTLNVNDFAMSFRLMRNLGIVFGVSPYSSVGYDFSYSVNDPSLLSTAGFVSYTSAGSGGLYQLYGGLGTSLFKRLSVGAEVISYMGSISKESMMSFSNSTFRTIYSGYSMQLNAVAGKFGVQYEQPVGGGSLTIGATYKTKANLKGRVEDYKYASLGSVSDTVSYNVDTLSLNRSVAIAGEIGIGISYRKPEKWMAEIDYVRSDWAGSGFDSAAGFENRGDKSFSATVSQSIKAGFEFIPNRNDIRYYFRQCAYRGGLYYQQAYYKYDGNTVDSYGLTLGMTLPVVRAYNGVNLGMEIGKRGSRTNGMMKENFVNFSIGVTIHDQWFRKQRFN